LEETYEYVKGNVLPWLFCW